VSAPLCLGVIGLGRAFLLMRPTFLLDSRIRLVAAADPRPAARAAFVAEFGGRAYETAEALIEDAEVEAVYIATPHQFHEAQVLRALAAGKAVLVEKPMALDLAAARRMAEAAERAGLPLIVGHSHSFDAPYLLAQRLIGTPEVGRLRMIVALNFTDYLYRPRRPEELDTAQGGGVVFGQAPHQVEVVRLLGGGRVRSVRAMTARPDPRRPTEGLYAAFLTFEDGAFATLAYSGMGHFDSDAWMGWAGELGQRKDPAAHGAARAVLSRLPSPEAEAALKESRTYGAAPLPPVAPPERHNHFGPVIAVCDHADLLPDSLGVAIHGDAERRHVAAPLRPAPRAEVVDELVAAVREGVPPLHSARWSLATMEVVLGILASAETGQEMHMREQVGVG
jgi:phthalate 4,5-cis-dihydrodiol dehydrogenase